jgi:hypothetical protein
LGKELPGMHNVGRKAQANETIRACLQRAGPQATHSTRVHAAAHPHKQLLEDMDKARPRTRAFTDGSASTSRALKRAKVVLASLPRCTSSGR